MRRFILHAVPCLLLIFMMMSASANASPSTNKDSLDKVADRFLKLSKSGGIIEQPKQPEEYYHNARIYELRGDILNARSSYEEYIRFDLDFIDPINRYFKLASIQENPITLVEIISGLKSKNYNFAVYFNTIYFEEDANKIHLLNEIIEKNPNYGPAYYELSRLYSLSGKTVFNIYVPENNIEGSLLKKYINMANNGHVFKHYIDKDIAINNLNAAKERLDKLDAIHRQTVDGYFETINYCIKNKNYRKALEVMKGVEAISPEHSAIKASIGWLLILSNDLVQAAKYLEKALQLDINYFNANLNYAHLSLLTKHHDTANQFYLKAIKIIGDDNGKIKEAIDDFDTLIELNPSNTDIHNTKKWFVQECANINNSQSKFEHLEKGGSFSKPSLQPQNNKDQKIDYLSKPASISTLYENKDNSSIGLKVLSDQLTRQFEFDLKKEAGDIAINMLAKYISSMKKEVAELIAESITIQKREMSSYIIEIRKHFTDRFNTISSVPISACKIGIFPDANLIVRRSSNYALINGIRNDDIIAKVNNIQIDTYTSFIKLINSLNSTAEIVLSLDRNGTSVETTIKCRNNLEQINMQLDLLQSASQGDWKACISKSYTLDRDWGIYSGTAYDRLRCTEALRFENVRQFDEHDAEIAFQARKLQLEEYIWAKKDVLELKSDILGIIAFLEKHEMIKLANELKLQFQNAINTTN